MNTLTKRQSPFTNSVGSGKSNRSVTLPDAADSLLPAIASELGLSVNEFCRQALAHYAAARKSGKALAFSAAISANTRQQIATIGCLAIISFITVHGWIVGDDDEFRKTKSCVRVVRSIRRGKEMEA